MPPEFFILAFPRTGSYALTSLLDSAEDIICHGEVFKQSGLELRPWVRKKFGADFGPTERDENGPEFIRRLRRLSPQQIFGFKVFPEHLSRAKLRDRLLTSDNWRKIVLLRDPIEVYASLRRARATGVWVVAEGQSVSSDVLNTKVEFSEDTWTLFIDNYLRFIELGRQASNAMFIEYNDIGITPKLAEVLTFIGSKAPVDSLQASVKKQFTGTTLEDAFSNWETFAEHLSKHPLPKIVE